MAHEAPMEDWSHDSRTNTLASDLKSTPAGRADPGTGRCLAQPLGNGKPRARSTDFEGSERLCLDIDFYGSWQYPPQSSPYHRRPRWQPFGRAATSGGSDPIPCPRPSISSL